MMAWTCRTALSVAVQNIGSAPTMLGQRGILSLPDEILLSILEEPIFYFLSFQLVCRAFRERALQLPSLWRCVSANKNPELTLQRSGNCSLRVRIDLHLTNPRRTSLFIEHLEQHCSRWGEFTFSGRRNENWPSPDLVLALGELNRKLQHKAFPRLKLLHVIYNVEPNLKLERNEENAGRIEALGMEFYSTWVLPSLETLSVQNSVPSRINGSPSEFKVEMAYSPYLGNGVWDFDSKLMSLQPSFHRLTKLAISLKCVEIMDPPSGLQADTRFELLELKELSIRIHDAYPSHILKVLSAPNLEELKAFCEASLRYDDFNIPPFVDCFFPVGDCRWPRLKSLDLEFDCDDIVIWPEDLQNPLEQVFKGLPPKLLRLHLISWNIPSLIALGSPGDEQHGTLFPPLQRLHLECSDLDAEFLVSIREILESPHFKELEMYRCYNLSEDDVRSILPPEKTLIYDHYWEEGSSTDSIL